MKQHMLDLARLLKETAEGFRTLTKQTREDFEHANQRISNLEFNAANLQGRIAEAERNLNELGQLLRLTVSAPCPTCATPDKAVVDGPFTALVGEALERVRSKSKR